MIKIISQKIIHRKYPSKDWEFKAVSLRINDNGKLKDLILEFKLQPSIETEASPVV